MAEPAEETPNLRTILSLPSAGDASEFIPEKMLRPKAVTPSRGWRRAVHRVTGLNLGPSADELSEKELIARAMTPIVGCRRVAVVSRKGGVGKTTTVVGLGHTFATCRGDRVIALDANPDAGSLAFRIERQTASTLTELLAEADRLDRYADVRAHTSQSASRLEILASDNDPVISRALGEEEYGRALGVLERHYNLILVDTGAGVLDLGTQGILKMADQLVVCAAPTIDGGKVAALTLDWLNEHGYEDQVSQAVVVVNQVGASTEVDVSLIERHFSRRCRRVVRVPWDPHLATGAQVDLAGLRKATKRAYLELAAAVAEGFALGVAH
jgi:putative peptide zinc metalloprotease protein